MNKIEPECKIKDAVSVNFDKNAENSSNLHKNGFKSRMKKSNSVEKAKETIVSSLNILREYSEKSSIHGVQYLGERNRPISEKLWWIIIVVLSLSICVWNILSIYAKWEENLIVIVSESTPIWKIPFPAVTICPLTKTVKSKFNFTDVYWKIKKRDDQNMTFEEFLGSDDYYNMEAIGQLCDAHLLKELSEEKQFGDVFSKDNAADRLKDLAPVYNDSLMFGLWQRKLFYGFEQFHQIITEEGLCYTFNMLDGAELFRKGYRHKAYSTHTNERRARSNWTLEGGYSSEAGVDTFPGRSLMVGPNGGLSLVLKVMNTDMDHMCSGADQGFKVTMHSPSDVPQIPKHVVRVLPGEKVIVYIKPRFRTTFDGLKNYDPLKLQCYFNKDKKLKYFESYTQGNCELECLTNFTLNKCGCVKFSMPRDDNTKVCGAAKFSCTKEAEEGFEIQNFNDKVAKMMKGTKAAFQCNCLPACTSIDYMMEDLHSPFDYSKVIQAFNDSEDEALLASSQLSRLEVYFKEDEFTSTKRVDVYDFTDFLGNCGGLLGLFMGFSLISLAEIVYHFAIRLCSNFWSKKWRDRKKKNKK